MSGKCIGNGDLNSAKLEAENVVHVQQNIEKDQLKIGSPRSATPLAVGPAKFI